MNDHRPRQRLRRLRFELAACVFAIVASEGLFAQDGEPGDKLALLKPLVGSWEGRFERGGGHDVVLLMTCEFILDGTAVRVRNTSGGMVRESVYYWNPHRDRLEFLVLTNNGHVGSGTVAVEAGLIVENGEQITPSGSTRTTRGTWERRPEGGLVVRGYTFLDGEWRPGHVIVFEETTPR